MGYCIRHIVRRITGRIDRSGSIKEMSSQFSLSLYLLLVREWLRVGYNQGMLIGRVVIIVIITVLQL